MGNQQNRNIGWRSKAADCRRGAGWDWLLPLMDPPQLHELGISVTFSLGHVWLGFFFLLSCSLLLFLGSEHLLWLESAQPEWVCPVHTNNCNYGRGAPRVPSHFPYGWLIRLALCTKFTSDTCALDGFKWAAGGVGGAQPPHVHHLVRVQFTFPDQRNMLYTGHSWINCLGYPG